MQNIKRILFVAYFKSKLRNTFKFEDGSLLRCDVVYSGRCVPTFNNEIKNWKICFDSKFCLHIHGKSRWQHHPVKVWGNIDCHAS